MTFVFVILYPGVESAGYITIIYSRFESLCIEWLNVDVHQQGPNDAAEAGTGHPRLHQ